MEMLKKFTSGVLALLPCSPTGSTLRALKELQPCWMDFFEHFRGQPMRIFILGVSGFRLSSLQ